MTLLSVTRGTWTDYQTPHCSITAVYDTQERLPKSISEKATTISLPNGRNFLVPDVTSFEYCIPKYGTPPKCKTDTSIGSIISFLAICHLAMLRVLTTNSQNESLQFYSRKQEGPSKGWCVMPQTIPRTCTIGKLRSLH
mmetsp:Transcript_23858/g.50291  ORF Transcript_23858/g.50291 Transcript_23858/m.50291 type:complete len:139 (-) Transcript_23858:230-646(-)